MSVTPCKFIGCLVVLPHGLKDRPNNNFFAPQRQHWHVYRKWNQRLFKELSAAYKAGRMGADRKWRGCSPVDLVTRGISSQAVFGLPHDSRQLLVQGRVGLF